MRENKNELKAKTEFYEYFTHSRQSHFTHRLIGLMLKADSDNLRKLGLVFPHLASVVKRYKTDARFWGKLVKEMQKKQYYGRD